MGRERLGIDARKSSKVLGVSGLVIQIVDMCIFTTCSN